MRPLPPELHNRPERIRAAVEQAADGDDVVVAYADCGRAARSTGFRGSRAPHCYELFGGDRSTSPARTS